MVHPRTVKTGMMSTIREIETVPCLGGVKWNRGCITFLSILIKCSISLDHVDTIFVKFLSFSDKKLRCQVVGSCGHHLHKVSFLFPDLELRCHIVGSCGHHLLECLSLSQMWRFVITLLIHVDTIFVKCLFSQTRSCVATLSAHVDATFLKCLSLSQMWRFVFTLLIYVDTIFVKCLFSQTRSCVATLSVYVDTIHHLHEVFFSCSEMWSCVAAVSGSQPLSGSQGHNQCRSDIGLIFLFAIFILNS